MSQIFSYNFDNNINLRSNSLITNELHVKDPITGDYKAIVPNNNEDVVEVPYYADTNEINFGINATKITSSKAEFRDTTTRHSELNFSNLKIHNAGAETKYQVGAISWKDNEDEDEKTMLLSTVGDVVEKIAPIEDYLKENSIEMFGTNVFNAIKPAGVVLGSGTNPASLINRSSMTINGFRVAGNPSSNYTQYGNGIITNKLGNELNLEDIINSQKNYLKPDKIEFADGSGLSAEGLSYKEGSTTITKTIKEVLDTVPDYIQPEGIRFQNIFEDYSYPIEVKKNSNNVYARIRNNEIGLMNALYGYSSELGTQRLTLRDPREGSYVTTEYGNDEIRVNYGQPIIYTSTATRDVISVTNKLKDLQSTAAQIDAAVAASGGTVYPYLKPTSIETVGAQSITHKINSGDSLNRYSLTSNRIHHQNNITVGNNPSSGQRAEIQRDRIYLYEGSGEFSAFFNDHIRYVKGGEVKYLYYGDVNETIDKVNKGYIAPSFWSYRGTSKTFWIGKYEKALETTYNFPSSNIIQFSERAVRNSGKLLFRMRYDEQTAYSAGSIIKFIFRVQKPTTTPPEGPALVNQYAMITAHICDVPRKPLAKQYLGALVEVVSVGPSLHEEDVDDLGSIDFENEYFAYYTLQLRTLKAIPAGELDFTMMLQFHGYLGDFGSMPSSMYVA